MRPDQWDRVQELFDRALECPADERRSFLDRECADDPEVRAEVESLLGYGADELVSPTKIARAFVESRAVEAPERIDGYRVIRKLGEGGMGVVYEAEQEEPVRRTVALKRVRAGVDSEQIVARFQAEQQALALMNHPNIARVYDAGVAADGWPYFVMEYAPGQPITQYCDEARLTTRQRLELFIEVCEGIQHAHQKGIIHRDIKPSNVLVTEQDGRPVPKIIDFGIARAIRRDSAEMTGMTEVGQVVGTLAYMSPEQARMTGHDIDTRTDVYALGILLYELLIGTLPFDVTDERVPFDEVCRQIREEDPPRPSNRLRRLGETSKEISSRRRTDPVAFVRALQGDLDWIAMRALEKDRGRRYASASELAADIRRFLRHEPVTARPPGALYRTGKFARRHRVGVGFAAALILALIAGVVATSLTMLRAQRAEREANRVADYLVEMFREPGAGRVKGEELTAVELLDVRAEEIRGDLPDEPGARGRLMVAMAEAYRGLGEFAKSAALLKDALPLIEAGYGSKSEEMFNALNELGNWSNQVGDFDSARRYFETALPIAESRVGVDHENVATILKNLSDSLMEQDEHDAARAHLERALEIRTRVYGENDPHLTPVLSSLAKALTHVGDRDAGVEMARRSLEIRKASFDPDDRRLGFGFYSVAKLEYDAEQYEAAASDFGEALRIWTASLGSGHANVGACCFELAKTRLKLKQPDEAYSLYRRARSIHEAAYGAGDPATATALAEALDEFADFLDELERPDEAAATRDEATSLRERYESSS